MSGIRKRLENGHTPASVEVLDAISNGLVALYHEYYGESHSWAKTYYQDDLVVCLLRGGFTRVEQKLQEGGHAQAVVQQRRAFQDVMRTRFADVVERATRRHVLACVSGNQLEPDMMCEVFVLAPGLAH